MNKETPSFVTEQNVEPSLEKSATILRRDFLRAIIAGSTAAAIATTLPEEKSAIAAEKKSETPEKGLQKEWHSGSPAFKVKPGFERFAPMAEITEKTITLNNRGIVILNESLPRGGTIEFTWTWKNNAEGGEGDEKYTDHLTVVLQTDGRQQREWAHEAQNGIALSFQPNDKRVLATRYSGYTEGEKLLGNILGQKGDLPMPEHVPHRGKIVDRGNVIDVFFGDMTTPVLTVPVPAGKPEDAATKGVAVYNREPVAGVVKTSTVENVHVTSN